MLVQCPECKVKYNLPEEKVKPGVKLKCTKCSHIFPLELEEDKLDLDSPEDIAIPEVEEQAGVSVKSDKKIKVDLEEEEKAPKRKKSKKKLIIWLIVLLLLLGLGSAGYIFFPQIKAKFFPEKKGEVGLSQKQIEEKVKNISLENVKQYFVNNSKIGELFVIEGEAVNKFEETKELIKIKARIFDDSGKVVAEKEFLAGNTASLFQLQVLTQEELEGVLNSKIGILTNNTFVKPQGRVPFMVVFYNPPENVQEFALEVIDVKNPPEKK